MTELCRFFSLALYVLELTYLSTRFWFFGTFKIGISWFIDEKIEVMVSEVMGGGSGAVGEFGH